MLHKAAIYVDTRLQYNICATLLPSLERISTYKYPLKALIVWDLSLKLLYLRKHEALLLIKNLVRLPARFHWHRYHTYLIIWLSLVTPSGPDLKRNDTPTACRPTHLGKGCHKPIPESRKDRRCDWKASTDKSHSRLCSAPDWQVHAAGNGRPTYSRRLDIHSRR